MKASLYRFSLRGRPTHSFRAARIIDWTLQKTREHRPTRGSDSGLCQISVPTASLLQRNTRLSYRRESARRVTLRENSTDQRKTWLLGAGLMATGQAA